MMLASLGVFIGMIRIILGVQKYRIKKHRVHILALVVVAAGMHFGKFGALIGLPWWIYYPIPLFANILLPPLCLRMTRLEIVAYLFLSVLSAPFIHLVFSLLLGWKEYMPFWHIPHWAEYFD